jgi:glycosyltransferase involved in cell wall biosynthesis
MRGFSRRYRRRPNWQVVRNGIDLSEFSPRTSELPGDLGVPVGAQVVAFVAAMRAPKGHADAVAAWPAVLARAPQARLLLVGSGPEEGRLREQVTALGLQERVVFAGVRSDIAGILRASSLALLTSETEALPTTLIEAAACGRAAVAMSVGGVPEVVEHGRNGLLVERGNVDGIASAVADLLLDDDRREAMGLAGRDLALERFDMHGWARRLRSVYDRARAGRPALR